MAMLVAHLCLISSFRGSFCLQSTVSGQAFRAVFCLPLFQNALVMQVVRGSKTVCGSPTRTAQPWRPAKTLFRVPQTGLTRKSSRISEVRSPFS
jgi:hypothetical protein